LKLATSLPIAVMLVLRAVSASAAAPPNYPERPVRLVVPFGAGGSYDPVARVIAVYVGDSVKQQIIVDNRGGASGIIGAEIIAKATPDAYTVGLIGNNHTITQALRNDVSYDVLKDFSVISRLGVVDNAVVVHPSLPVKTLKDFIALAKAKPGAINFGSTGTGGSTHLVVEFFKLMANVDLTHIPYKGTGPAVTDLLGGQIQLMIAASAPVMPHVRNGRLRALAVTGAKRLASAPDLPTVIEAGVPEYDVASWYAFVGPKGLPGEIAARWNAELQRLVQVPEVKEWFASGGLEAVSGTPEEFMAILKRDVARWAKVTRQAGIKQH